MVLIKPSSGGRCQASGARKMSISNREGVHLSSMQPACDIFTFTVKVVFSRKGFDSGWGGVPSPILTDGRMVSFPIPDQAGISYSDLRLDEERSYAELMRRLGITTVRYPGKGRIDVAHARAHLDPDVVASVVTRELGWRPMFGQVGAAQGHLRRQGVGPGDLLLFYGWFSPTMGDAKGRLRYVSARDRIQAMWGYLQIDSVLTVADTPHPPPWARSHPHFELRDEARFAKNNTVYVATDRLSFDTRLRGAGPLGPYRPNLRLTRVGATPSVWDLPIGFHPSRTRFPMTGNATASWSIEGDRAVLRAARIGQEFVAEVNDEIAEWLSSVLEPVPDWS
jgi:Nucleotide modification associated domain 3